MKRINWHGIGAFVLCILIWGPILCYVSCSGCTGPVSMSSEFGLQFGMFVEAVEEWNERCQEQPETCRKSLSDMAQELRIWNEIIQGNDSNETMYEVP